MIQDVFIIGANGNVGSMLVKQIFEKGDTNLDLHQNPTRIVGLASVNDYLWSGQGLSPDVCYAFADRKTGIGSYHLSELINLVQNSPRDNNPLTFVDVTAAREPMRDFHLKVIQETPYGIVTSNKNPLTMVDSKTFAYLAKHTRRYGFRCSVMAGANALDEILDFRDLGDPVKSIMGCFSGTLGYICSELDEGKVFSKIVADAKNARYTEPHPRDDLSGKDVAKKILILSRSAGLEAEMEDIQIKPFIPKRYLNNSNISEFMKSLSSLDNYFNELIKKAQKEKKVLRYVARMSLKKGKVHLDVGPRLVERDSALGLLKGTLNKIVIITDTYTSEKPCIIEAPGAGLQVTAQNVRRDLLKQLQNRIVNYHE